MAKGFTLGSNERLKSRKSIEQLFRDGKKFVMAPYKVLYILATPPAKPSLLFGVAVSTKNFKRAVDRNRVKRLTREAYRLQKRPLQQKIETQNSQLNVFFIYTGKELPDYHHVYEKMGLALIKLDKLTGQ